MKKCISVFAMILMLALGACSQQDLPSHPVDHASNSQSQSITILEEGVWPINEYTEGLPVPSGTVVWAMLDTEHKNCSINITDIRENDYHAYMEILNQEGFSMIENVSEEIDGENYVSIGSLLTDGEKGLSISYIPDNLTMYISFDNEAERNTKQ